MANDKKFTVKNGLTAGITPVIDQDGNWIGPNSGLIGYTGSQGVTGFTGSVGFAGSRGVTGFTGSVGFAGSQGIQGVTGFVGSQGVTGFIGSQGIQGITGFSGSQGVQGPIGFTGSQGIQGIQGIQGFSGSVGATGFVGSQGIQGVTGFVGSKGDTGFVGSQGIQGVTGFVGSQGPIGFVGSTGDKGGVKYTFSTTTTDADPGIGVISYNNATLSSVTNLFIDNVDAAGITQTAWYDTWDDSNNSVDRGFVHVVGNVAGSTVVNIFRITGAVVVATGYYKIPVAYVSGALPANATVVQLSFSRTGNLGFTGSQGIQGVTGFTGSQGIQGVTGFVGSQGIVGFTGSQGIQGIQGVTGFVGSQGAVGFTGSQGIQGVTGFVGSQGIQGVTGFVGSQGIQGVTGFVGSQGIQGVTGFVGSKGDVGFVGSRGQDGNFGGATFDYTFDNTVTAADPGVGRLKFNNATLSSATSLYIDASNDVATDISTFLNTIDDSTSTIKGHFRVSKKFDASTFALYTITSLTNNTGWFTVVCSYVSGNGTLANNDDVIITFARTGDRGDTGFTGSQGIQGVTGFTGSQGIQGVTGFVGSQGIVGFTGSQGVVGFTGSQGVVGFVGSKGDRGEIPYVFSSTVTDADPGNGTIRYDNATIASVTNIFIDNVDSTGVTQTTWYDTWDNSTNGTNKGYIYVLGSSAGSTVVNIFRVTGAVVVAAGYYKIPVAYVSGMLPANATGLALSFSATGDLGYTGSQGAVGFTGSQGIQGVTGFVGSQGIQGVTGFVGSQGVTGFTGSQGIQGVTGFVGSTGDKAGVKYTFSTVITDADPGNGVISYNNAVVGSVTNLFIDNIDAAGITQTTWYDTWDDSNNSVDRGYIYITGNLAGSNVVNVFRVTGAVTVATGYYKIPVAYVSGALPANATVVQVSFSRTGNLGFTGSQGVVGFTGSQGIQGVTGFTGSQGIQGVTGFVGSKGDVGFTGSQGIQGIQGVTGFTGSQGIQGVTGFVGSQGIQGVTGFVGSQGIQGVTGFVGSRGVTGFTGSQGFNTQTVATPPSAPNNGDMWFDTESGTIKVYYNDGDTSQWVTAAGTQGAIGFTGSQGIQGVTGFVGSQGIQGVTGFVGSQGVVGFTGSQGIQGVTGFTGSAPTVAGVTNSVQYNNAGVLGGTANFTYDATTGSLHLTGADPEIVLGGITNEPASPAAGNMLLYAKQYAGRSVLKSKGASGLDVPYQAALWGNNTVFWTPTTATAGLWVGTAGLGAGTYTTVLPTSTNVYTSMKRASYANIATTANQVVGQRNSELMFFRGGVANQGGFFFFSRFGFNTWANGARMFAGMHTATTVVSANPSLLANTIGFHVDTTDNGLIYFGTRDATTLNRVSTGFTITANTGFDCYFYCAPGVVTSVGWRIVNINTQAEASGTLSANLPVANTMLTAGVLASNGALTAAAAVTLGINRIYVETDY